MKILLTVTTVAFGALAFQALRSIPGAAKTGYLLGWSEKSRGEELNYDNFGDRIVSMQNAQRKAHAIHQKWHADNPGKSCEGNL